MSDALVEAPPPPISTNNNEEQVIPTTVLAENGEDTAAGTPSPHAHLDSPAHAHSPAVTVQGKIEVSTPHDLVHEIPVSEQMDVSIATMPVGEEHVAMETGVQEEVVVARDDELLEARDETELQQMELQRQIERAAAERNELDRQALERSELERQALERSELERRELERTEMERQSDMLARQRAVEELERARRAQVELAHRAQVQQVMDRHQMELEAAGQIPEVVSAVNSISDERSTPPTAPSPGQLLPGPPMGHVMTSEQHLMRMQGHQIEVPSPAEMGSPPGEPRPNSPQKIEVTTPHGNLQLTQEQIQAITEAGCRDGQYFCTLCQKKFGYKNGLIRHIRLTHVGEKPYECNICQRRFGYKHILMEHQNLHFGNRPYACTQCDKRFAARSNLIQHRMVHKRPYNCQLCNKRFDREDQLKKHMFAHPQAMLQCNVCRYSAQTQADLNKHMVEKHNPQVMDTRLPLVNSTNTNVPGRRSIDQGEVVNGMTTEEQQPEQQEVYPDSQSPNVASHVEVASSGHDTEVVSSTPPVQNSPISYSIRDNQTTQGSRVDKICHQLSASVAMGAMQAQSNAVLVQSAMAGQGQGVMVKKELDAEGQEVVYRQVGDGSPPLGERTSLRAMSMPQPEITPEMAALQQAVMLERQISTPNGVMTSLTPSTMAQAHPQTVSQLTQQPGVTPMSIAAALAAIKNAEAQASLQVQASGGHPGQSPAPALPAIGEVFGTKPKGGGPPMPMSVGAVQPQQGFPPGIPPQHFPPGVMPMPEGHRMNPDLPMGMMSPPGAMPAGFPNSSSPSGLRPPLPTPGASSLTQLVKGSRDAGVQYNAPIPDFPTLDDVINYYVGQGILFRCQHCSVLFFERGMFFLHASLHGTNSPWECSICHKQMNDRNEFTLHFVNQKHN